VLENKRKFERFDLSVITQFVTAGEATKPWLGVTKNFSREGLSIETRDFDFTPNKNLELELKSPEGNETVSLIGNVVWGREVENTNIAGIKLVFQDENIQNEILEKISSYGNIPRESVLHSEETHREVAGETEEESAATLSAEQKNIPSEQIPESGFVKQYISDDECKVTFRLLKEAAQDAQNVTIVGDFNDWDTTAAPMTRLKDGAFQITLNLSTRREYKFRYLVDGARWENDWRADKYTPNSYGCDDSVVVV
jgi:hypothetical protein